MVTAKSILHTTGVSGVFLGPELVSCKILRARQREGTDFFGVLLFILKRLVLEDQNRPVKSLSLEITKRITLV